MKIAVRSLYFLIFIFSAIYVFKQEKYYKRIEILNGYVLNFHIKKGEILKFYLNTKLAVKKGWLTINDINGTAVDSVLLNINNQNTIETIVIEKNQNLYTEEFKIETSNLKQGFYLLGNKIPFWVRDTNLTAPIKIIFPFFSLQSMSNAGGKSFISYNSTYQKAATELSLKRTLNIDEYSINLINWMNTYYPNQYDLCPDYLIKEKEKESPDLLILYGNTDYITIEVANYIEKLILKGTDVLSISSTLFQHIIRHNSSNDKIYYFNESFLDPEKIDTLKTGLATEKIFNSSVKFKFGLKTQYIEDTFISNVKPGYFYIYEDSTFSKNIKSQQFSIENVNSYNGIWVTAPKNEIPKYDLEEFKNFHYFKIIGESKRTITDSTIQVGNIIYFQKSKKSGRQISIGCSDWLIKENLNKANISKLTKSFIDEFIK